ncbi:LPXTG-motif cell wall anchor domain-containing protein [Pelagirhabdus alkalitolerans]|uniref:LPXTG-motif cell wall anchor domain-containing protein n=1 Tax=Pelagirhabdus alkalitolerans TaxID=1612202 RepID=A0A1G6J0I3_9BACI|nr:cadherin-like beta sandwich domain-containing protein [Pelagirhabdus alkalitolerans]SDC12063.1 LPXTG-motif cell wall anchor domain-containing protein [Pelagirhabdus alkalitolerans]
MRKKVSIIMIATLLFGLLNPIFSDSIVEASENVRLDVTHNLEYRNGNTSSTGLNNGLQIGRGSETALKFDLSTVDVNRIKDVELRVYVSGSALPPGGSSFINVWGTDDDNWDEGSASIPDKEQLLVERDNIGSLGDVLFQGESDLTNFIKRSAQENEFVTFVFSGHNDLSLHISHRDRGDRAPYLKITYYEPPTDISLTNHEIEEFQPSGTVVGSLSADADDDQISYSLQSGDVSDFIIEGNELRTASEFDYEDQSTYDLTIRAMDSSGQYYDKNFQIDVNYTRSADLENLELSEGTLNPDFDTNTLSYTAHVENEMDSVQVIPTLRDTTSSLEVNGRSVISGEASEGLPLEVGENPITIEVTAQNGDEKTYTLTVDRAPSSNADLSNLQISEGELDPEFDAETTNYEVSVGNNTETLAITPTVDDETAIVSVNGSEFPSGEASENLPLEVGENAITVEVTAQNGDEKTYTLTVDRAPSSNADLSNLQISEGELDPDFDTATSDYEVSVGNNTETLAITPTVDDETATVSVNGSEVPSGEASESMALEVGENLITVEVTAQNGDEKTYTLTVDRAPSSNADLSNLQISEGELDPDFDTATTDYEVSVGNNTETLAITPTVEDETAIVSVNGSEIPSGEASENLPLEVGKNPITVEVTAQNGDKKTYTLTVDRASSSNADLSYLDVSEGTLQPDFQKDMKEYNMLVNYDVDYLQVTAFTDSDDAELKINGQTALSGEGTDRISLEAGAVNEVDITVIAEDLTIQNYQINVTRLLQRSVAAIEIDGQTATVSDRDIMIIEENGILSIELPEEINHLQLSEDQIEYLIAQNINIEIMKPGIKMSLPSSNFNTALAVEISIEKIESSDSIDDIELSAGTVYQFSIDHGGQILDQFDYGVELAFDISDEETNPELLNVYYWNDELRDWEYVDGEYNDGKILATTEHFSTFGVFNSSVFQEVDEGQEVEEDKDKESTLPRTASSTYNWLAIGALLMLAGLCMILYRRYKIMK